MSPPGDNQPLERSLEALENAGNADKKQALNRTAIPLIKCVGRSGVTQQKPVPVPQDGKYIYTQTNVRVAATLLNTSKWER